MSNLTSLLSNEEKINELFANLNSFDEIFNIDIESIEESYGKEVAQLIQNYIQNEESIIEDIRDMVLSEDSEKFEGLIDTLATLYLKEIFDYYKIEDEKEREKLDNILEEKAEKLKEILYLSNNPLIQMKLSFKLLEFYEDEDIEKLFFELIDNEKIDAYYRATFLSEYVNSVLLPRGDLLETSDYIESLLEKAESISSEADSVYFTRANFAMFLLEEQREGLENESLTKEEIKKYDYLIMKNFDKSYEYIKELIKRFDEVREKEIEKIIFDLQKKRKFKLRKRSRKIRERLIKEFAERDIDLTLVLYGLYLMAIYYSYLSYELPSKEKTEDIVQKERNLLELLSYGVKIENIFVFENTSEEYFENFLDIASPFLILLFDRQYKITKLISEIDIFEPNPDDLKVLDVMNKYVQDFIPPKLGKRVIKENENFMKDLEEIAKKIKFN